MKYSLSEIVFKEIPTEVTLLFYMTGCPMACRGCHSSEYWDPNVGTEIDSEILTNYLGRYKNLITTVLFMGGEWNAEQFVKLVKTVKENGLKCGLYTGKNLSEIDHVLIENLDYIKVGKWLECCGGLDCITTNQRFYKIVHDDETYALYDETARFRDHK